MALDKALQAAVDELAKLTPSSDVEAAHLAFIGTLLADAQTRVEILPGILHTQELADNVRAADLAAEKARAAALAG